MCRNGRYTEHGIKELDGFLADRVRLHPAAVVPVPTSLGRRAVLVEPASVVAKAWEHIERIGAAGGLVAAAGPGHRGRARSACSPPCWPCSGAIDVDVVDVVEDGPKPALVAALGARYVTGGVTEACASADIVLECTGVSTRGGRRAHLQRTRRPWSASPGVSSGSRFIDVDAAAFNRRLVLENDVVFGSVNANAGHYRHGRGRPGPRRPRLAGRPRDPSRAPRSVRPRLSSGDPTTSRW